MAAKQKGTLKTTYKKLAASAMFIALTAFATAYFLHIPIGANGGYIHLGDTFIYLAASLLPLPYAAAAGALGGGLADLLSGAPAWILPTMIIKPLSVLCFSSKGSGLIIRRNLFALPAAGLVSTLGYFLAETAFTRSWQAALLVQWGNLLQWGGSVVLYLLVAAALDRLDAKKRFYSF